MMYQQGIFRIPNKRVHTFLYISSSHFVNIFIKLQVWLTILELVGDCPLDSVDHPRDGGTILLLVGDHHGDGVQPDPWDSG